MYHIDDEWWVDDRSFIEKIMDFDLEEFIRDNRDDLSFFLLLIIAIVVVVMLWIISKKKSNEYNEHRNIYRETNDERTLNSGGWKCSVCKRDNASYVTTCPCGRSRDEEEG